MLIKKKSLTKYLERMKEIEKKEKYVFNYPINVNVF